MPDFRVTHHGSVCTVQAVSEEAKTFAEENFAVPGWAGLPTHFTTDTRVAIEIVSDMFAQGFEIEGL